MKRVLIITDLPQIAEHLKAMVAREQDVELAGVQASAETGIAQASTEQTDIVIVDGLIQGKIKGREIAKRIRSTNPGTRIVLVTVPTKPEVPRPEEGVDAVFVLPGGANELTTAMGAQRSSRREGKGQMIAVYSPKGGTGKTTIAVNLACTLRRNGASVALVDGVMQFGSVRHLFEIPDTARSIIDLPAGAAMRASISEAVWEGPGGVDVLFAPPRPEQAELVSSTEIANAMSLLADTHDYVIVDTPVRLHEDTLPVFDEATTILLVITYMAATLATTRAAIDTFDALGYRGKKPILLVLNQADTNAGISRGSLEHTLNLSVVAEIPTDFKLIGDANNKHTPFVLMDPNAPASKAMGALATALVTQKRG
ncbi:MAG: P-loop NTPase [Chloroflexi bacterium]|nr:P-loop NTPase [Chloroflexota bacterium]